MFRLLWTLLVFVEPVFVHVFQKRPVEFDIGGADHGVHAAVWAQGGGSFVGPLFDFFRLVFGQAVEAPTALAPAQAVPVPTRVIVCFHRRVRLVMFLHE